MPTIYLYHLASLTSLRKAPNGSIKRADPEGMMFHTFSNPTSGESWAAHFYGMGVLRQVGVTCRHRMLAEPVVLPGARINDLKNRLLCVKYWTKLTEDTEKLFRRIRPGNISPEELNLNPEVGLFTIELTPA